MLLAWVTLVSEAPVELLVLWKKYICSNCQCEGIKRMSLVEYVTSGIRNLSRGFWILSTVHTAKNLLQVVHFTGLW